MTEWDPIAAIPEARRPLIGAFEERLLAWNRKVNLVSRASMDAVRRLHIDHSLALATRPFPAGSTVVDWGTGGGLPAIPLAICFPAVEFVAVDSIGKKARAVRDMVAGLGLDNVTVWHGRAENWDGRAHYAVSRATTSLAGLWSWTRRVLTAIAADAGAWQGGLLALKGGDLGSEESGLRATDADVHLIRVNLQDRFGRPEWAGKYIVHVTPGLFSRA